MRRPHSAAAPAHNDDELDNGGVDVSEEEQSEDEQVDSASANHSPIAHRTRSRSVSPHTTRTTKTETITFTPPPNKLAPTLSATTQPPPQPIQSTYQPALPSSSVVFPLVTKRRLRFWIPLLVSLLLTALLLYMRSPHQSHSPARWNHRSLRHGAKEDVVAHQRNRREAVYNPSHRAEYDQYASHQDDKEEMAREHARQIINEVHGVAAQIKQEEEEAADERQQPHYQPLKTPHPNAKDIARDMRQRYETTSDSGSGWVQRAADWLGFGPYMRLEKRQDGVHHVRGDDEYDTDKYDYMRSAVASNGRAAVHEKQSGEGEVEASRKGEEEAAHSPVNSMLTHLKKLEQQFTRQVDAIKQRITDKTVPPYKQIRAEDKQPTSEPSSAATASTNDDRVPVQFISSSPDHPLLDPLHSILGSVESLIARPVTPPTPPTATSYWSQLMHTVFPSAFSETARDMYDVARLEASREAGRVRRAMTAQYDKVRAELRAIGEEVTSGTSEPLELYEQYNPEPVDMEATTLVKEKAKATTHHTKEK